MFNLDIKYSALTVNFIGSKSIGFFVGGRGKEFYDSIRPWILYTTIFNMIKTISILLLSGFFVLQGKSQDTAAILSNATVLKASEEEKQFAISKTSLIIKDINQVAPLFENFTLIGSRLWNKIKNESDFKDIEGGNVTLKIPKFDEKGAFVAKQDVQGKLLQNIIPFLKLWTFIRKNYDLENCRIVDMNNKDRFIFWLYFAKIEEPIVSIQSEKARLIIKYVKGKIFFIDIASD